MGGGGVGLESPSILHAIEAAHFSHVHVVLR
jgi:hypothetical protein